jgi:hypothetical protein
MFVALTEVERRGAARMAQEGILAIHGFMFCENAKGELMIRNLHLNNKALVGHTTPLRDAISRLMAPGQKIIGPSDRPFKHHQRTPVSIDTKTVIKNQSDAFIRQQGVESRCRYT